MGIPYYFYNIYKKYNNLTIDQSSISKIGIDYLFLDYNSLIHPCAQEIIKIKEVEKDYNEKFLEDDIIENCIIYTRYIINVVGAKNVYIMIDGVAPRAKMNQQRERRYKTHFLKKLDK
jgi:5'-3' exonuclease